MKFRFVLSLVMASLAFNAWAKDTTDLKTDKQKFSYTAGFQIGQNLKRQNMDLDAKAFSQGVADAIGSAKPKLKPEEMHAVIESEQKKQMEKSAEAASKNKDAGTAFLEANKKKQGIVVRPSGLQYKVITEGKGKQPTSNDSVVAHYRGTLIDGTEFDSSYSRNEPATFPVKGVIKGWQEVLPLMKEGSKWQVYIPSDLAYGPRGTGGTIGPNATLIFDIELISVKSASADTAKEKK